MIENRIPSELLRREVQELTELLRTGPHFAHIREALFTHGFQPSEVVLAGFATSDDEIEHGVFLAADLGGILFEIMPNSSHVRWDFVTEPDTLTEYFPAVSVGIAMLKSGEIS